MSAMAYLSVTFPGTADYLSEVRKWTAMALGDRAGVDDVVLVASELAANALRHTASGEPGGTFTLHLATYPNRWQVRVDDQGGPQSPAAKAAADVDEAGRGLTVVEALASGWGVVGDGCARGVWAEVLVPEP